MKGNHEIDTFQASKHDFECTVSDKSQNSIWPPKNIAWFQSMRGNVPVAPPGSTNVRGAPFLTPSYPKFPTSFSD